jgi:hypothetical protein
MGVELDRQVLLTTRGVRPVVVVRSAAWITARNARRMRSSSGLDLVERVGDVAVKAP